MATTKTLHSKRSMHQRPNHLDSPAYDASEEDNDPLTDDAASAISLPVSRTNTRLRPSKARHALAASSLVSETNGGDHDDYDTGVDSPTYDGDIESSTTAGPESSHPSHRYPPSIASTLTSPVTPATQPADSVTPPPLSLRSSLPSAPPQPATASAQSHAQIQSESQVAQPQAQSQQPNYLDLIAEQSLSAGFGAEPDAFSPAKLTAEDIQEFIRRAIAREGPEHAARKYQINPPPQGRPVRIYADGVYDLFHFGHALQLRQAKLSFSPFRIPSSSSSPAILQPGVHLLVGVNTDEACIEHKNRTVMTHAERCEAVRHCRWVDEVIPEAPWVIDQDFIDKYQIDYVAHDEDPYVSGGHDDVYAFAKNQGKFIPTRRTPLISTSDLLERIVTFYRLRVFDKKLEKMGHRELMAEGSDWDDSAEGSRVASGLASRDERR